MSIKKKLFMLNKLYWDLTRGKEFYSLSSDVSSSKLREYYILFDERRVRAGKDQALITEFDENGIPLNKTYIDVDSEELVYFPISIGQLGLAVYHTYLKTGSNFDLERFLKFAEWFENYSVLDNSLGARWMTNVPLPQYDNPGPWQSAFAQSRAISILLRGYQATGNENFKELSEKALIAFTISVSGGGVVSETEWGPFYEEYTAKEPVLVLNGHIFSLFGVYDFCRVFPENETAKRIFENGFQTLINGLEQYDLGYWTKYNDCRLPNYPNPDPATLSYQRLHIMLLKAMNTIRPNGIIKEKIKKWEEQLGFVNYIKANRLKYKALKRLNRV